MPRKERHDMPRFVILKHIAGSVHYDLMFEHDGVLMTFRAKDEPRRDGVCMEASFDHPLKFLDFEGALKNAPGRVEHWDKGTFTVINWSDKQIDIECRGRHWKGRYILSAQDDDKWLARKQSKEK
jgi:bifunctional non-homologous end joining protein LigD